MLFAIFSTVVIFLNMYLTASLTCTSYPDRSDYDYLRSVIPILEHILILSHFSAPPYSLGYAERFFLRHFLRILAKQKGHRFQ